MKDKKKFGGCSLTSKNRSCKKFGWSYDKETKRIWRIEAKRMAHKTSQIEFVDWKEVSEGNYIASGENPAASLTFNDKGFIIGSFRVVMPNDDANMKKIQQV